MRTADSGRWKWIRAVRQWTLWTVPARARVYVLLVDALGLTAAVLAVGYGLRPPGRVLVPLLICALLSVEGARRVERFRHPTGDLHKDLQASWALSGALVLPPGAAVLFAVAIYGWWRLRAGRCRPFAWAFTASMQVLAVLAAGAVFRLVGHGVRVAALDSDLAVPLAVLAAAVVFEAIDVVLCGVAIIWLSPGTSRAGAFGNRATAATDAAALTFGGLVAILSMFDAWATLLAVPAVVLLQRVLLVDQLAAQARTDGKTGLATAGWWRELADAELDRSRDRGRLLAVLVADLDHFKRINDRYGHLVGDAALGAVAGVVRAGVRGQDLAGRFGGEEFVVALPDTDGRRARVVAERLRERVSTLEIPSRPGDSASPPVDGLTVSIGVAVFPEHADTLDTLLRIADRALYVAKDAGRNRVAVASPTVQTGR